MATKLPRILGGLARPVSAAFSTLASYVPKTHLVGMFDVNKASKSKKKKSKGTRLNINKKTPPSPPK